MKSETKTGFEEKLQSAASIPKMPSEDGASDRQNRTSGAGECDSLKIASENAVKTRNMRLEFDIIKTLKAHIFKFFQFREKRASSAQLYEPCLQHTVRPSFFLGLIWSRSSCRSRDRQISQIKLYLVFDC